MKQFIAKFADRIEDILWGFDRLVMRGELRALYIAKGGGIEQYLRSSHVMFKDFGLIMQRAMELSVAMPITAAAEQVYAVEHTRQSNSGRDEDFSAVIRTMEQLAGI